MRFQLGSSSISFVLDGTDDDSSLATKAVKMLMRLSIPIRYPSSWFPTTHGVLWSMFIPAGKGTVFPKSISHTQAFSESWTNNRELPMSCKKEKKIMNYHCVKIAHHRFCLFLANAKITTWFFITNSKIEKKFQLRFLLPQSKSYFSQIS